MINGRYRTKTFNDAFQLDKNYKKDYIGIKTANKSIIDDETANSALDYLYSDNNRNKTQSFLQNNGFPSAQEREYNKELYGEEEEQTHMQDLLKSKVNSILKPTLPDDNDRAFFKGIMGDDDGERDYQKQLSAASRAQRELKDAFSGSQFENQLNEFANSATQKINSSYEIKPAFFNAKDEFRTVTVSDSPQEYGILQSMHESGANKQISKAAINTPIFDGFNDIFNKSKQTFQDFGNCVYETQKTAQRAIWRAGARHYLGDAKEYYTSAWMLEHSLQDNPSDIWRGNDSRIANLINNDKAYLDKLDEAIKASKDGTIDTDLDGIQFDNDDLFFSIHKATIHVTGRKQSNGKWIVHAKLSDKYDFTEFMTFMDDKGGWSKEASLGTVANDAANISQKLGAINPYMVNVEFYTTR